MSETVSETVSDTLGETLGDTLNADFQDAAGLWDAPQYWVRANLKVILIAWALCAALSAIAGVMFTNPFMGIGGDSDDMMRYLQLRDLMNGQGWFDLSQGRLGMSGTAMHWSRLADLPYLVIAIPLEPILGVDGAIRAAGSVVPALVSGLFALGLLRGMSALGGEPRLHIVAAGVVALHILAFPPRFAFGAFDHHHLQIALLALALGYSLVRRPGMVEGAIVGLAVAASVTIGLESAPVMACVCAFWALRWWVSTDADINTATRAFGGSLFTGALAGWVVFTDSGVWSGVTCDAYGSPLALLLAIGGGGLWGGAVFTHSFRARTLLLTGMAVSATAIIALTAPSCVANPMDALPPEVSAGWLSQVREAKPITSPSFTVTEIIRFSGVPLVASLLGLIMARRRRDIRWAVLAAASSLALLMTFYQVRFYTFAVVPAALIMARLLLDVLGWETRPDGSNVGPLLRMPVLLAVLFSSSAGAMGAAGGAVAGALSPAPVPSALPLAESTPVTPKTICTDDAVLSALKALPPGHIHAGFDLAPNIMRATPHTPLAGNYHRGASDIALWLQMTALPADQSAAVMRARGVDYLLVCEGGASERLYADLYPAGLFADIPALSSTPGFTEIARPNAWVRVLAIHE